MDVLVVQFDNAFLGLKELLSTIKWLKVQVKDK